jgi:predicted SAM-dependent methyltransferase
MSFQAISTLLATFKRAVMRWRAKLRRFHSIRCYLRGAISPKLHIGCGPHKLSGWLNTDVDTSDGGVFLDATKRLPFEEATFDFVYCEHMIEHISVSSASGFLDECLRVLKPGGTLRIATPDMACLFKLWRESESPLMKAYISNAAKHFVDYPNFPNKCMAINNFFYNWGHQFIYDEETLVRLMKNGGFDEVQRTNVSESSHAPLTGLERHALSIGDEFNSFETMVIEGRKPLA